MLWVDELEVWVILDEVVHVNQVDVGVRAELTKLNEGTLEDLEEFLFIFCVLLDDSSQVVGSKQRSGMRQLVGIGRGQQLLVVVI